MEEGGREKKREIEIKTGREKQGKRLLLLCLSPPPLALSLSVGGGMWGGVWVYFPLLHWEIPEFHCQVYNKYILCHLANQNLSNR